MEDDDDGAKMKGEEDKGKRGNRNDEKVTGQRAALLPYLMDLGIR